MSKISGEINNLVKDQSHCDVLLMHLMKKYHGPQGVLNVLAEKHKKCWESLNCLKLINEKLKVCTTMHVYLAMYVHMLCWIIPIHVNGF